MKVCGIDLGTTYSAISWYDHENRRVMTVELVNAADNQKVIPSVVYYPQQGSPVVGDTALNAALQHVDRVAVGVKRSIGTDYQFKTPEGVAYTPQEISAEIIKVLVQEAEACLGEKVTDVVITVPAYFGDNENAATREAGALAGLNVLGLMAEPHAAALAYVVEKAAQINEKDLLVYDLGGGTFDITLIHARLLHIRINVPAADGELPSLEMITLCKRGNTCLGGLDWDKALAGLVAQKALEQHGVDVLLDPKNEPFLMQNCEKAKRHLSRTTSCMIVADLAGHAVEVSRQEFEELTAALLFQSECLVEQVLKDAIAIFQERVGRTGEMDPADVDLAYVKSKVDVMLTGGSSKMPMVKAMLKRVLGRDPFFYGNPELLVTIGAAYYAYLLKAGPTPPPPPPPTGGDGRVVTVEPPPVRTGPIVIIVETTMESYGIAALRRTPQGALVEIYAEVLPKNTRYADWHQKEFGKAEDNLTEIEIVVYSGDSHDLSPATRKASFVISGLPAGGKAGELVRVQMGCVDGVLTGSAIDLASGKVADFSVKRGNP